MNAIDHHVLSAHAEFSVQDAQSRRVLQPILALSQAQYQLPANGECFYPT